jgi:hypothetical protein
MPHIAPIETYSIRLLPDLPSAWFWLKRSRRFQSASAVDFISAGAPYHSAFCGSTIASPRMRAAGYRVGLMDQDHRVAQIIPTSAVGPTNATRPDGRAGAFNAATRTAGNGQRENL